MQKCQLAITTYLYITHTVLLDHAQILILCGGQLFLVNAQTFMSCIRKQYIYFYFVRANTSNELVLGF